MIARAVHVLLLFAAHAGVPVVRLQKLLGHATAAMTMQYMEHAPEAYIAQGWGSHRTVYERSESI